MKKYILAKNFIKKKHVGSLVNIKEVYHNTSGKTISREHENCIVLNYYKGLMFECCMLLKNREHLIYDLDSKTLQLYISYPKEAIDD